jgi:hypothetical protein
MNSMSNRFDNTPLDPDTSIIQQQECQFGEYQVLYQKWRWDGITAETVIFVDEDVAGLTDEEIQEELKQSALLKEGSMITIKRSSNGFTFLNFNFETD